LNTLLYRWLGVLCCPPCGGGLDLAGNDSTGALVCDKCLARYAVANGIPRLVPRDRQTQIEKFCAQYEALRLQEGWASELPEFYSHLPFHDVSGRHAAEWKWRAKSFRVLEKWLRQNFAAPAKAGHGLRPIRILDAGAGSGWMSRLLAERYEVLALDVNVGPHGLAALPAAQRRFMAVQGELDRLPLTGSSFDLVIANASLHYAKTPEQFLQEAHRVLRPGGKLVVMDSPAYPTTAAAQAAQARTRAYYAQKGVPELAENYSGLVASFFDEQAGFRFHVWRADFAWLESLKRRLREKLGQPVGARFPMWVGELLPHSEKISPSSRLRAGALIVHENKLLAFGRYRRGEPPRFRIPGGGIEPGETPEQAAQRELQEEIGVTIRLERLFGRYLVKAKTQWYFLANTDEKQLPADDAAREGGHVLRWLPLTELASYDLRPQGLKWELVKYFKSKIKNRKS
jgi:ubiquinone/menaquinone biosynthesis C-methylase UbiE/8-oxo-dGTP pyrophosphatase MutT (NUDIX family)/uncharacterized protein YbaR (Trm112 family)